MKRIASFLIPLATLLIMAVPVLAQTQYRFEVFGGGTFPTDKDFQLGYPQVSPPMDLAHEYEAGFRGGVRLGVDGRGHWGQDFLYSYGANSSRIVNRSNGADFAFTPRIHQAAWNLLWYPGGLSIKTGSFPYLTAGVGGTIFAVSQETVNQAMDPNLAGLGKLRTECTFTFNAGGGVRIRLRERYGIRVDFRDFISEVPTYGLPESSSDPNATVYPATGLFHQFEFSFAFVYYF
jgi:hypothetical protein